MNERIRELAEEAGFRYIKDEGIGWAGNHNSSLPRFAELIVAECVLISRTSTDGFSAGRRMAERFGVESLPFGVES